MFRLASCFPRTKEFEACVLEILNIFSKNVKDLETCVFVFKDIEASSVRHPIYTYHN